jgi:hypothetical protein
VQYPYNLTIFGNGDKSKGAKGVELLMFDLLIPQDLPRLIYRHHEILDHYNIPMRENIHWIELS